MNKNTEQYQRVPLVHGRMIYRCENCGRSWPMYLEKGIEEFGENHKPSPFTIACPYCGGWAVDVSGIQKVPGGGYVPLPGGYHYFANVADHSCGVPAFNETLEENELVLVEEALERLRSREMELCRERMREELDRMGLSVERMRGELDRMEKIVNMVVRKNAERAEKIERASVIAAEKIGMSLEEARLVVLKALQDFGRGIAKELVPSRAEPDLTTIEPDKHLDVSTAWDRIETRKKQRAADRKTASRFRQYCAKKPCWAAGKRTGARRREWHGPWKEN